MFFTSEVALGVRGWNRVSVLLLELRGVWDPGLGPPPGPGVAGDVDDEVRLEVGLGRVLKVVLVLKAWRGMLRRRRVLLIALAYGRGCDIYNFLGVLDVMGKDGVVAEVRSD
jgi:hypothetical protein